MEFIDRESFRGGAERLHGPYF